MEEITKISYVSPPHGELGIALIRDANPRILLTLDLGIPNFTVFTMALPLAQDSPNEMSGLIAESVHVLCDEVTTFMMSLEYEKKIIIDTCALVLSTFRSMSQETDTSKQDVLGQDPIVKTYEGTFEIPQNFINETQKRVITGAVKIKRDPKVRHIELTYSPKDKIKPSDTARVIRQYRQRNLKNTPRPMYVVVYDLTGRPAGTISVGTGKNFKNELLKLMKKSSVDFTSPVSFINEQEMKSSPLDGIPRAISVGGMTYQPEAISGSDMALYHGPQDYVVKFTDGRSAIFPGRPTFRKMRTLNFPVPRSRYRWTLLSEESLNQKQAPKEETVEDVKEAADEPASEQNSISKDTITSDQIMQRGTQERGLEVIRLKPKKTYDDLVPLDQLKKRLQRDKLADKPIMLGKMLIERMEYYGVFEGKTVLLTPCYFLRRYGIKRDDGTWAVYHRRGDGRAQKVGFRPLTEEDFFEVEPAEPIQPKQAANISIVTIQKLYALHNKIKNHHLRDSSYARDLSREKLYNVQYLPLRKLSDGLNKYSNMSRVNRYLDKADRHAAKEYFVSAVCEQELALAAMHEVIKKLGKSIGIKDKDLK